MKKKYFEQGKIAIIIIAIMVSSTSFAQQKYNVSNRNLSEGKEKGSIHLNEESCVGVAWINGMESMNGKIEVDIKGKDILQQSFVGIAFHGTDDSVYEAIYFRPFNFRSSDPVRKTHAVQYVSYPGYDWPVLRTQFPNKYEQTVSPVPDPNNWFHARIELNNKKIMVFVNGNDKPSLVVESLQATRGKKIGYWVGNNSSGDWKNLKVTDE
jgi:hypothetical protein